MLSGLVVVAGLFVLNAMWHCRLNRQFKAHK